MPNKIHETRANPLAQGNGLFKIYKMFLDSVSSTFLLKKI